MVGRQYTNGGKYGKPRRDEKKEEKEGVKVRKRRREMDEEETAGVE